MMALAALARTRRLWKYLETPHDIDKIVSQSNRTVQGIIKHVANHRIPAKPTLHLSDQWP